MKRYTSQADFVQLKKGSGVSSIQSDFIGPLCELDEEDRKEWIEEMKNLAALDVI
ncbi:hypothetical protein [Empedobacter brevis]|uniref:hypothetical protein n=1 Tax=Empedobacter brevis TaxID=247 RepID=UPI0028A5E2C7|nr:hypothetical protein [Empedobacter brevis]